MNVGKLKEIIKNIPDDYSIEIQVQVHPDDLHDVLEEGLVVASTDKNQPNKVFFIGASLWNTKTMNQRQS